MCNRSFFSISTAKRRASSAVRFPVTISYIKFKAIKLAASKSHLAVASPAVRSKYKLPSNFANSSKNWTGALKSIVCAK
ncbi:Protein of unknown function [Bacillus mycoides]|nr:Protein of unknown function [Bacillus mycoides]